MGLIFYRLILTNGVIISLQEVAMAYFMCRCLKKPLEMDGAKCFVKTIETQAWTSTSGPALCANHNQVINVWTYRRLCGWELRPPRSYPHLVFYPTSPLSTWKHGWPWTSTTHQTQPAVHQGTPLCSTPSCWVIKLPSNTRKWIMLKRLMICVPCLSNSAPVQSAHHNHIHPKKRWVWTSQGNIHEQGYVPQNRLSAWMGEGGH